MAEIQTATMVAREEEHLETKVLRKGKYLIFFDTEWWETVSSDHVGNDIHINTQHPIRDVYLNGKLLAPEVKK
jgi:hypothetical protein